MYQRIKGMISADYSQMVQKTIYTIAHMQIFYIRRENAEMINKMWQNVNNS